MKKLVQARELRQVVQRDGASVYETHTPHGRVFVKATTNRVASDRHCEILEALEASSLAPKVLERLDWGDYAVVVLSALAGKRLDHVWKNAGRETRLALAGAAGSALGRLHRAIPPSELLRMECWQERDGISHGSIVWKTHLDAIISKWRSRLNPAAVDYPDYCAKLDQLLQLGDDLRQPLELHLLHCDYIGRNILTDTDNHVSGILDFETARIGDAVYDLAKIVWVDMDFTDEQMRGSFLAGWEAAFGEEVPRREFLYYVGVQCLAAIAWTDKNEPLDGAAAFRTSAIRTLGTVVEDLQ